MVLVRLKKDWFGPGATLYQSRDNPHEFPADWAAEPSEEQKKDNPKQRYAVLPSSAEVLEGGRTVAVKYDTADGTQLVRAEAVEGDVKSVGGALNDKGLEEQTQTTAKAASAADDLGVNVGGNPRESGPLPAGAKKLK